MRGFFAVLVLLSMLAGNLITLAVLLVPKIAAAHPTAFKGSVGLMGYHSPTMTHNQINYSFRHWFASGVHYFRRSELGSGHHATFLSGNFLLKRWNGETSQANLYAVAGGGISKLTGDSEFTGLGLAQFDVEDRRYYFFTKNLWLVNNDKTDLRQFTTRVGMAPYVGDYEDLHTWIVLEWQNFRFGDSGAVSELTPFLRFFYNNVLFEIGQSFDGNTKINFISHF